MKMKSIKYRLIRLVRYLAINLIKVFFEKLINSAHEQAYLLAHCSLDRCVVIILFVNYPVVY